MKYASNQKIVEKEKSSRVKALINNFIDYLEVQAAPPGDRIQHYPLINYLLVNPVFSLSHLAIGQRKNSSHFLKLISL